MLISEVLQDRRIDKRMPHCCVVDRNNESENKDPLIPFHRVPLEGELSKKWLNAP